MKANINMLYVAAPLFALLMLSVMVTVAVMTDQMNFPASVAIAKLTTSSCVSIEASTFVWM